MQDGFNVQRIQIKNQQILNEYSGRSAKFKNIKKTVRGLVFVN